jgi:hypothetical protein
MPRGFGGCCIVSDVDYIQQYWNTHSHYHNVWLWLSYLEHRGTY